MITLLIILFLKIPFLYTCIYFTYIVNRYFIMKEAFLDLQVKIQKKYGKQRIVQ